MKEIKIKVPRKLGAFLFGVREVKELKYCVKNK